MRVLNQHERLFFKGPSASILIHLNAKQDGMDLLMQAMTLLRDAQYTKFLASVINVFPHFLVDFSLLPNPKLIKLGVEQLIVACCDCNLIDTARHIALQSLGKWRMTLLQEQKQYATSIQDLLFNIEDLCKAKSSTQEKLLLAAIKEQLAILTANNTTPKNTKENPFSTHESFSFF